MYTATCKLLSLICDRLHATNRLDIHFVFLFKRSDGKSGASNKSKQDPKNRGNKTQSSFKLVS